jgi:hypothetical protein
MRPGFWLWPLPPTGTLRLSCEWPALDIPFTTTEIDTHQIRDAAEHPITLWDT